MSSLAPKRIALMLESDGPGGAEMMLFRFACELRARGHVVVPVGPAKGIGWLGELLRGAGFVPETVNITARWLDVQRVRALTRIFREHRVDLVHSHEFEMAVYGSVAARVTGRPHIITMHGGTTVTNALKRRVPLRMAMRLSACSTVVSDATARQFADGLGMPIERFAVVRNGVPVVQGDADRVRDEFNCHGAEVVLLAVGTLDRNKAHHILLEALARLDAAGGTVPWKLIIAGGRGGDQHEALLETVRQRGWQHRVHIVTRRNDIADLQALADIFVMPSLWEGLPMAMLEAMLAGNAVVASATGGIPEAIADGADGLLVPPGDPERLAAALHRLLTDVPLRARLAQAGQQRAQREFTVGVMTERYESLYARALGRVAVTAGPSTPHSRGAHPS